MPLDPHLPPHLEQFIRDQLATGRFQSESEVIQTALGLMEEHSHVQEIDHVWLKQELDKGLDSYPAEPLTKAFWDHHRDRIRAGMTAGDDV